MCSRILESPALWGEELSNPVLLDMIFMQQNKRNIPFRYICRSADKPIRTPHERTAGKPVRSVRLRPMNGLRPGPVPRARNSSATPSSEARPPSFCSCLTGSRPARQRRQECACRDQVGILLFSPGAEHTSYPAYTTMWCGRN